MSDELKELEEKYKYKTPPPYGSLSRIEKVKRIIMEHNSHYREHPPLTTIRKRYVFTDEEIKEACESLEEDGSLQVSEEVQMSEDKDFHKVAGQDFKVVKCPCGCGAKISVIKSDFYEDSVVIGIYKEDEKIEDMFSEKQGFIFDMEVIEELLEKVEGSE